ncbi:MAG: ATP-binding protein [bacterium]
MKSSDLKSVIVEQNSLPLEAHLISRDKFRQVVQWHSDAAVVVISGLRRCGKSTLLSQLRDKFKGYYLNFDDERLVSFTIEDFQKADEIFHELYGDRTVYYFDEIQNVPDWERFVRRLRDFRKKVYITGSNARLMSRELGTHLTGRYLECTLFPFSFREFLQFKRLNFDEEDSHTTAGRAKLKRALNGYFESGGMPEYLKTENREYLKTLYESILYRDILVRNKVANETAMRELMLFVFSNIGKLVSFNKLRSMLGLKSPTTVKDYFQYLRNSFLVFLLPKLSYSLKKNIYADKKVYLIDTSFARCLGFRLSEDLGRFLENLVFIELLRREQTVFYFHEKYECDFVVTAHASVEQAIQVCYEINRDNEAREINGLLGAMQTYHLNEGLLLTYEQEEDRLIDNKSIRIVPVWKWLLDCG